MSGLLIHDHLLLGANGAKCTAISPISLITSQRCINGSLADIQGTIRLILCQLNLSLNFIEPPGSDPALRLDNLLQR